MQLEVYEMESAGASLTITLAAVCDFFSSLIWDAEYYKCGQFEVYIPATIDTVQMFKIGRIIGRSDDTTNYGIIEAIHIETNAENGDYLTVSGRFLMSLLSRRIIYPTLSFTNRTSYGDIVQTAVQKNCTAGHRRIPSLKIGSVSGKCWDIATRLQISYANLMEWIYGICETIGGTANIRLVETTVGSGEYEMMFELTQGVKRSILQNENPHIVFSDGYNNLLSLLYDADFSVYSNVAYVLGEGEGAARKRVTCYSTPSPAYLDRHEIYVDASSISSQDQNDNGETIILSDEVYEGLLEEYGYEKMTDVIEQSESTISIDSEQFLYDRDYFVGDYVTVHNSRFGLMQNEIQLTGMIECLDQNGRSLTPIFNGKGVS